MEFGGVCLRLKRNAAGAIDYGRTARCVLHVYAAGERSDIPTLKSVAGCHEQRRWGEFLMVLRIAVFLLLASGAYGQLVTNPPGGSGGGGSGTAVFSGSQSPAPAFSATPTFSLAAVSNQSPTRIEPGVMTANVTSVTFTNIPTQGGAKFSIAWTQAASGGPYTVAYGGSTANTCQISPTPSIVTTQEFEVGNDGATVKGTGCTSTETGVLRISPAGTLGAAVMGNATSGTVTLEPATGALGSAVVLIPGASDTLVNLGSTQTLSNKTFVAPALGTPVSGSMANLTGLTASQIPAVNLPAPGATCTFTANSTICIATTTATITVPVPAAGYQFCVMNDDNVSTVITLSAIGSSARYENTARTAYGTAGTGTFVSGGAVGDAVCLVGRDSTHYLTVSYSGNWTPS